MPDIGPSINVVDIARAITPKSGKGGWFATGPAGSTQGTEKPLIKGGAIPRGLFAALGGRFRTAPYTGGRVPPGSTVTYSNPGYYEPYRGSPNTRKKKVRSKKRVNKWVDNRALWEKMLDWATNPSTWKGEAVDTRPMREQSPEQQAKFREYMAGQMIRAGADIAITAGGSRVRMNTPTLKPAPTMRTYSRGPTPMDPIEVPALPKVTEPRLPVVYPGYAPPRPGAPATLEPLEEVVVTAQRVGRISPPLSDDRYSVADAVADDLSEVEVTAKTVREGLATDMDIYNYERVHGRTDSYASSPGPGRATTSPGTARSTGTATKPGTSSPGSSRTSAPVALPGTGPLVLPVDALLRQMLRQLSSRPRGAGKARQRLGATTALPGLSRVPQRAPQLSAVPWPAPFAPGATRTDDCQCDKPKKSKPRQPRTVCYAGSYRETAKGLSKRRREQVPCN